MSARRHYQSLTYVLCALAAVIAVACVRDPLGADGRLLDLLIAARALVFPSDETPWSGPVAVIALDARSLNEPEFASYPRAFLAPVWSTLLEATIEAGARAVGFDILFAYSANRFVPNFDAPFLAALSRYRSQVVLARSATTLPAPPFLAALRYDEGSLGLAEIAADPDGRYRRMAASLEISHGGRLPTFAGALLRRAKDSPMPVELVLTPRRHLERIPTYAAVDVLRCATQAPQALSQVFAGKIILVGSTLPEEDRRVSSGRFLPPTLTDAPPIHPCGLRRLSGSVPEAASVPGVFLHAAAVEAVASGRVSTRAPRLVVGGLAALMAALGAVLGLALAPWATITAVALSAAAMLGLATSLLAGDFWLPLALPLGALTMAPVPAYVVRYVVEERTRRRLENAFSHYLSPAIVDRLSQDPSSLKLGGERREVTVMFADLSGFTDLSGKVEPEVLVRITNQYLGYIVEQVEATGGYVDKFIGDAVMALWGAPVADPQHAVNGLRAAMGAVSRIRTAQEATQSPGALSFAVKIGLNSGMAVVGNVGTEKRYNYTAVGEMVNVAARLESVPTLYACQVVVGPRTAELAESEFLLRELDTIQVKGRETPFAVWQPLAEQAEATPKQRQCAKGYAEALAHYRAMRYAEAKTIWERLAQEECDCTGDPKSNPSSEMAARARVFMDHPPTHPWDGVWVLANK
jgi:class 3 adenylate cyclase/CHASE2 domain-containing sensor protein